MTEKNPHAGTVAEKHGMVILHIASIHDTSVSGLDVAVPQHIKAQSEFAQIGFVNVAGERIPGIENQFPFDERVSVSRLPAPFCAPDLIVFHEVYRPAYLRLYRQAKAAHIPYIIIPHGCLTDEAQSKKKLKKAAANILLFNAFINGAAMLQFLSQKELERSCFGKSKMLGTNGVFMPEDRKTGFHNGVTRFVYIGRTEVRIKGLDLMLRAIRDAADRLRERNAVFCLYGPDFEGGHGEIRRLIEEFHIADIVELNGPVIGEEKKAVLLDADIFIQTSRSEAMPMGILEAMSYGIPVVVTKGTSLGDLIERYNAGWVAETDVQSIAQTILRALEARDCWEEKSGGGVSLIRENFMWSAVAHRTLESYQQLLE